jgi:hypothetical protein
MLSGALDKCKEMWQCQGCIRYRSYLHYSAASAGRTVVIIGVVRRREERDS